MLNFCGKVGAIAAVFVMGLVGCDGNGTPKSEKPQASQAPSSLKFSRNLQLDFQNNSAEIISIVGRDTLKKHFDFSKPVERIVALSSAQIGYLLRLGAADRIVAVGEGKYIADTALFYRAMGNVSDGAKALPIAEIGYGNATDYEKLMALKPDFVMTFATGGGQDDYERLGALGLPAMLTSEWQEESALAKAEWIKLYGMMLGGEFVRKADSLFDAEVAQYNQVAARGNDNCPKVLAGMSYGGVWYAPGGNSYTARLIKDAGGCYLWASDTSRELKFTLEEVMAVADSAELWVNPGMYGSPEELKVADPRVANFRPFREGRVYQNDGRKGPGGGIDFFEGAVARPAEVLQNLHTCFFNKNCGVNPDGSPSWYRNIF